MSNILTNLKCNFIYSKKPYKVAKLSIEKYEAAAKLFQSIDWQKCIIEISKFITANRGSKDLFGRCSYIAIKKIIVNFAIKCGMGNISAKPAVIHGIIHELVVKHNLRLIKISFDKKYSCWVISQS